MIYQLCALVFLALFNLTFSEVYIPKTPKEKEEFSQLQKENLTIALFDEPFYNLSYPGIPSLNDTCKTFLKDYMQLNVDFKTISYKNLEKEVESSSIDGVALIPKNNVFNKYFDFSNSVFHEKLYVVSQNTNINSLEDLNDKIIYTPYMQPYLDILDAILENNNLRSYEIPVEDLNNYKNNLILTPNPILYKPNHGIKIANSSGVSIALTRKYEKLIPFINSALNEKYQTIILNNLKRLTQAISYNNFYTSLTQEEKEYLKTLPPIRVAYENRTDSLVSYKSKINGKYKGLAPNIFKVLKGNLNIDYIDVTDNSFKTPEDLKNKKFDAMILSKTRKRNNDFIFSRKIYDIDTYVVNIDNTPTSSRTIGVLKDNVEEHLAKRYDVYENIIIFDDMDSMIKALDKGEVGNLLVTNKESIDSNKYNIIPFETIPVNLMFNKDNEILRDIVDKALLHSIDLKDLADLSDLERDAENKTINLRNKEIRDILILFSVLFIFIIFAISVYLYKEHLNKKNLLKDSLTDLPNRFIFDKFCLRGDPLNGYTFVIDLNNFKTINDSLGHEFGDIILKEFASFLKNSFKEQHIFRISGDEFYGFSFDSHNEIIEKLKKYKEFCPTLLKYNITFNVGLCYKTPDISLATSFRYSDLAMLETKKEKTSFYKIADDHFIDKMDREAFIFSLLKDNIAGIYAMFQPKYCVKTKKIIGAEALARYDSVKLGPIGPFEFIPIAEKYNFIHKVDYKIAKEAILYIRELIDSGIELNNFRISFNLSRKTFKRNDLINIVSGLLNHFNVPGKYIELEITESIFILDMKDLVTKLKALKDLGIQISLDDFTAGHSTAGLLPLLPIDTVKFDKSLLDSFEVNQTKSMIVYKNLISLIKDLNFKIVSEGVETDEQLEFLKLLEVDYIQGYWFSKPILKDELTLILQQTSSCHKPS